MIRITLKGNPGPLEEAIIMKLYLIIKTICEKILASARRDRGASGPFAGRCDANAPATLLLATADVGSKQALGGPQGRYFPLRSPGVHTAHTSACFVCEKIQFVHPLSTRCTHWGWRYAQLLPPPRGEETKSVVVLRTKVLSIETFRLSAERRAQRCNAS